jgi:hypothetical protein
MSCFRIQYNSLLLYWWRNTVALANALARKFPVNCFGIALALK